MPNHRGAINTVLKIEARQEFPKDTAADAPNLSFHKGFQTVQTKQRKAF